MSGLFDAFDDSTETALDVMQTRPLEPEQPKKRSAWTAPFRGIAAAGAELTGNLADISGAAGRVMATAGAGPGQFMLPHDEEKKLLEQSREAYDKMISEGLDFRNEDARPAYEFARDLRPDPATAGAAEQIVFGLTKSVSKAVGSVALFGPGVGSVAFGTTEGMTAAEDLAEQGVDKSTRTKVGLLHGGVSAASVALPVAGQTATQTAALVLAGGPLAFIGEQAGTRAILDAADYGEIAAQYDPLDPVGLTISTLLPAGFGAWAMRGMRVKPTSADQVDGVRNVIDTAPADAASPKATQEQLDAAMVHNLTAARDMHEATPAPDIPPADPPPVFEPVDTPPSKQADSVRAADAADTPPPRDAQTDQPDIPVRVTEDGDQVTAAKHLDDVRKLAQEGTDDELGALDAPLLKVAADCLLR